nr:hypothetical protein [uncultured Methanoregula sp.]
MTKYLVMGFSLTVLAGMMLSACIKLETPTSTFPTLEDAKRSGVFERGWIPCQLPTSAINICESHNLDVNRGIVAFSASSNELFQFAERYTVVPVGDYAKIGPFLKSADPYWPDYLRKGALRDLVVKEHFVLLSGKTSGPGSSIRSDFYMAIKAETGRAFIWY